MSDSVIMREPETVGGTIFTMVMAFVLALAWTVMVMIYTGDAGRDGGIGYNSGGYGERGGGYGEVSPIIRMMYVLGIMEELGFRILPLLIFTRVSSGAAYLAALVSAVAFAVYHVPVDSSMTGFLKHIGVGLLFGWLFLKCGGLNGKILKPSLCVIGVHATQNIWMLTGQ